MPPHVQESLDQIKRLGQNFLRPAVLSSFGKDSLVLLDLVKQAGFAWPVVFFREPRFPEKYAFANRVIEDSGLTVYDYPARGRSVLAQNGRVEIVNHYPFGAKEILVPMNLHEPEGFVGKYVCAKDDLLSAPVGNFAVPWGVFLCGHRDKDNDPTQGSLKLHVDQKQTVGCPTIAFPLRAWTDEQIWAYIQEHDLPIHADRYEYRNGAWLEKENKAANPDWFAACSRCLDKNGPEYVYCPKARGMINNIGKEVPQTNVPTYYGEQKAS